MNLVDSSGWIEYFSDGPNADRFAPVIEDVARLTVSSINVYEVFKKILQEKGEGPALQSVALMMQGRVVDVDASIALLAGKLGKERKLPMADSIILATARVCKAVLWTQDSDFERIDGVRYFKAR